MEFSRRKIKKWHSFANRFSWWCPRLMDVCRRWVGFLDNLLSGGNLISRIIRTVNHCNQCRGRKYRNFQLRQARPAAEPTAGCPLMGRCHISTDQGLRCVLASILPHRREFIDHFDQIHKHQFILSRNYTAESFAQWNISFLWIYFCRRRSRVR